MPSISLAKKIEIPIRNVFPNEERDFTKHFEIQENMDELASAIGIPLELVERESRVGDFEADLFAKSNEEKVIIENQYGKSNHDHLGKLMTYAAGKDAKTIIWIVEEARDEHVKTMSWLNDNSDLDIYLVEVKVFVVENRQDGVQSNPFVDYQVIVKPNEFSKETEKQNSNSPRKAFWNFFSDIANKNSKFLSEFSCKKPNKGWLPIVANGEIYSNNGNFYANGNVSFSFTVCGSNMKTNLWIKNDFYEQNFPTLFDEILEKTGIIADSVDESFSEKLQMVSRQYAVKLKFSDEETWKQAIEKQLKNAIKIKQYIDSKFLESKKTSAV